MTQFVFSFGTDATSINPFRHAVISCFSPSKYFSLLLPVYVDRSLFSGYEKCSCPFVKVVVLFPGEDKVVDIIVAPLSFPIIAVVATPNAAKDTAHPIANDEMTDLL